MQTLSSLPVQGLSDVIENLNPCAIFSWPALLARVNYPAVIRLAGMQVQELIMMVI